MITAIVLVSADRKAIPELGAALAAIDGVSEVYSVTGEVDFVAMVRAREHEELADIVAGRIGQLPGVLKTHTHVAFRMYSRHDLESVFGLGTD
ncbi:MAG TPA: Lrp/AsnC ligand binding domain-containing protein [Candidatus Limnocylindria bacterium]|jgi:DNA-binding Lrp family transcriptional regulator|nr:Lrp/AsnC ligand binding domain-containing protein [Candidatus Limnocylindria bacterium]